MKRGILTLAALSVAALTTVANATTLFFEGFNPGPPTFTSDGGSVVPTASGSHGIPAAHGSFYGLITNSHDAYSPELWQRFGLHPLR